MKVKARGVSLAVLATAFVVGVRAAPLLPPMPMSWLAAALCVVALLGSSRRSTLLVVCFLLGGARASADRAGVGVAVPGVDDRVADVIRGRVVGPVEDRSTGARFLLRAETPARAMVLVTVRDSVRAPVLPGDEVVVTARLRSPRGFLVTGAMDVGRSARARGADLVASVPRSAIERIGRSDSLWRAPAVAQRWMSDRIAARDGDGAAVSVVRAMVSGDRAGVDYELAERFRRAGASHLLAVSGLHLAVVTLLLFAVVRRIWAAIPSLAHRLRAPLAASMVAWPAAVSYTCATGARVSTLRALLVISIVLLGVAMTRRARVIDALGAAAVVLLVVSPTTIYDPSFQLSFAATGVLCLAARGTGARRGDSWWTRFAGYAVGLVRASWWATLATAPLTALAFGSVAPGGLVSNLLVVPLTELVVLPLGLVGVGLSAASPTIGGVLIDGALIGANAVMWVVDRLGAESPVLTVPSPRWWELVAYAAGLGFGIARVRDVMSRRTAAVGIGVAFLVILTSWIATSMVVPRLRSSLRVTFIDVGQGDAAVIEFPGGAVWLIDAGGRPFVVGGASHDSGRLLRLAEAPGEMAVLRYLAHRRVRRIDRVILTHPHPDHYVGLGAVARDIDIGEVWLPRAHPERPEPLEFAQLLWQLRLAGTEIRSPLIGVHEQSGVRVHVLHPRDEGRFASSDPALGFNDNSLVVRLDFGGRRILFLGDVEQEAEEILVEEVGVAALRADVVKVPHHGSATSSTQPIVDAVRARWAIISCGVANRFGFPSAAVVERWRSAATRVLRTDRSGSVTVTVSPSGHVKIGENVPGDRMGTRW